MIDTPFAGPRRLRFDAHGKLWIPGFSSGVVARFDPATREFREFALPIEPRGSETPYALNVHRPTGHVWICGTESDSLIRFDPAAERFTVFPLPTRVTYTREIDFDAEGRVWTSNSNAPTWQIEGGDAAAAAARSARAPRSRRSRAAMRWRRSFRARAEAISSALRSRAETAKALRGRALKARLRIAEKGAVELDGRIEERHRGRSYALLRTPAALLLGIDELRELPEQPRGDASRATSRGSRSPSS